MQIERNKELMKIIGKKLRILRLQNSISSVSKLKIQGVSTHQFSKLEQGLQAVSVDSLYKICNFFGISISQFFAEIEHEIGTSNSNVFNLSKDQILEEINRKYLKKQIQDVSDSELGGLLRTLLNS